MLFFLINIIHLKTNSLSCVDYILLHNKVINFHIWTFLIEYTEKPPEWIITMEWHILLPIILKSCLTSPKIYFKRSVRLHSTNFLYISQGICWNVQWHGSGIFWHQFRILPVFLLLTPFRVSGWAWQILGRLTESKQDLSE